MGPVLLDHQPSSPNEIVAVEKELTQDTVKDSNTNQERLKTSQDRLALNSQEAAIELQQISDNRLEKYEKTPISPAENPDVVNITGSFKPTR